MKRSFICFSILCSLCMLICACSNSNKKVEQNTEQSTTTNSVVSDIPTDYCQELVDLAQQGNAKAQCMLGFCYEAGQGVAKEMGEAVKWYKKAAEQGNSIAQNNLAVCYADGRGVAQDFEEALT